MDMEFEPKNREEKLYSEVRVSGMPEVVITHDSKDLLMPDRRSKSHNNPGGKPIGESNGNEGEEKQVINSAPTMHPETASNH